MWGIVNRAVVSRGSTAYFTVYFLTNFGCNSFQRLEANLFLLPITELHVFFSASLDSVGEVNRIREVQS
jgi:hypothetical protein